MIILKATTETLELSTSSAADIDYSISYADITTTTFSPSTNEDKITSATSTTVLSAPAASTQRQVKLITISNRHASTANTVRLKKDISGTEYYMTPATTLLAGETSQYIDGKGWTHYLANGSVQDGYPGAAGTDKLVQFNDGGNQLGADADFLYNKTNNHLEIGTSTNNGALALGYDTSDQAAESGKLLIYAKDVAGRATPKWIGPAGIDNPLQACLGFNGIKQVAPATGTTAATCMTAFATAFTNTATTIAQVAVTSTSIMTMMRSVTLATSAAGGNVASHFTQQYEVCGAGGYFYSTRFYVSGTIRTGQRAFHGLAGTTSIFTNVDPLTEFATAKVGLGYALSGTAGNWNVVASTTAAAMTAIDLGVQFAINITSVIELILFHAPGSSETGYRVTNLTTAAVASGTLSSNIPDNTVPLAVHHWVTNNATAAASVLGLNKWYLESDY